MLGMLWGWLPCGMVYSVLAGAAVSGDAVNGAAIMAAFGAGTLPLLLALGAGISRARLGGRYWRFNRRGRPDRYGHLRRAAADNRRSALRPHRARSHGWRTEGRVS